jgi:hypothetical protein
MNDLSGITLHCCVIQPPQKNSPIKNIHPISTLTNKATRMRKDFRREI